MSDSHGTKIPARKGAGAYRWAFLILMMLTLAKVWLPAATEPVTAEAQIPDAGAQRVQLVEEARRTNEILIEIRDILRKEPLQVVVRSADNQDEGARRSP